MQCHYEVLGVARDAGEDEIRKSYRKLALQWHPDKNPDRVAECTKHFHRLQQAYEVLSDLQERAWYDKHREAILRGGLGHGEQYTDSCLDVYQYFNTSCYSGYGDEDNGFYAVYAEVFRKIANEDREFVEVGEGEEYEVQEFGNSVSSYEQVVGPFYAHWESYCTARSYVWAEKYDTREAPNRQIRRLMEQDNKKLRDKAKRERNEEVRALVGFVRKRDRRVQAYKKKLEERAAEIARLAEEKKQRDIEKRRKDRENYKESEWSSMSALEQQLRALESDVAAQFGDDDDDDDYETDDDCDDDVESSKADLKRQGDDEEKTGLDDLVGEAELSRTASIQFEPVIDLYCVACNKHFKSEKALENHCQSRRHTENVELIKAEMEADQSLLNEGSELADDDVNQAEEAEPNGVSDDDVELDVNTPSSRSKRSKKQKKKQRQMDKLLRHTKGRDDELEDDDEDSTKATATPSKNSRLHDASAESESVGTEAAQSVERLDRTETSLSQVNGLTNPEEDCPNSAAAAGAAAAEATVAAEAGESAAVSADPSSDSAAAPATHPANTDNTTSKPKSQNQKSSSAQNKSQTEGSSSSSSSSTAVRCNKCRQTFPTRNKLFDHIKLTGHALRIEAEPSSESHAPSSAAGGKKKEKGKKAKR